MSLSEAVIDALVATGVTVEQLAAAMKASLAEQGEKAAEKRAKDAERQRKSRSNRAQSRNVTVTPRDTTDAPPNEYISNPPIFDVSNETSAASDFGKRVEDHWNGKISGTPLPKCRKITGTRLKHLRCRAKMFGEDAVFTAIDNMIASDFHSGRSGRWTEGSLGWLVETQANFEKMLERAPAKPPVAPSGKQWTPEERAEYLAGLERREEAKPPIRPPDDPQRNRSGPRPIGQVVRLTNQSQDQAA